MNADLLAAFRTITNHCRNHFRVNANCKGCEITSWCEDRDGYPKDWTKHMEEKNE